MLSQLKHSTLCAAAILQAWNDMDREELARRLVRAADLEREMSSDSDENERIELLESIVTELRAAVASGRMHDGDVYIPLLENLAVPVPQVAFAYHC